MARHRRRPSSAHRLATVLRSVGIVVALAVCLLAGAKLMSFAAGSSGGGHADAIGRSRASPHKRAAASASPDPTTSPSVSATPLADVSGRSVTAVGDSVMVAATPALDQALPGIYVNAMVGRQFSTGLEVITQLKSQGLLRPIVVMGLGTNGSLTSSEISQLFAEIGPDRRLVLVNTFEPRWWEHEVNSMLAAAAARAASRPSDVVLADWFDTVKSRPSLLWPDEIHPQPSGGVVYAQMLRAAVAKVAGLPG